MSRSLRIASRHSRTSHSSRSPSSERPTTSERTHSSASLSGVSNVQQLARPQSIHQSLPVAQERPFRRDLIGLEDYQDPFEPSLEQPVNLKAEVRLRQHESRSGWKATFHSIEKLILPQKIVHPGNAKLYIGVKEWSEEKTRPKYLYDSYSRRVVLAEGFMFKEGFVAVSYTWGRFRSGEPGMRNQSHQRDIPGCLWPVPNIELKKSKYQHIKSKFDLEELMDLLDRMPDRRYFWVDVLCINQYPRTDLEQAEKQEEIEKQAAIFENATGVLVYLWSIDAEELKAAMREFEQVWRWYWAPDTYGESVARMFVAGSEPCTDDYGIKLRTDPWFSATWTYQEMKLAPHSVWMTRDGTHCRLGEEVMTTHSVAQKFNDLNYREQLADPLHVSNADPNRRQILSDLAKKDKTSRDILLTWLAWAERNTGITILLGESRAQMLQTVLRRAYHDHQRDAPFIGALQISRNASAGEDEPYIDGIPLSMWNQFLREEGGRLFDCHHSSAMSNMLPGSAQFVAKYAGIRADCKDWRLDNKGQLKIPLDTPTCDFRPDNETRYQFSGSQNSVYGGDPETSVKNYLEKRGIQAKHVRFVIIHYQLPLSKGYPLGSDSKSITEDIGVWVYTAVRAVILVTESSHAKGVGSLWFKVGMVSSKNFRVTKLAHDITIGYDHAKRK